ncbi:hypothetical protein NAEGRDRAFT_80768 [Naegleria gruberi]|uniref:RNA-dependent RNA polymerase n=1 Tax=Naegleria gruberi TaxID=5762 RepID=D2VPL0_NAEGR|nr:uncharacterized protein NAEGRDRAFT_80768 [Naegleria gruberi]EFC41141.1 hypothetical protein NAEGRDRAFT_80768 [Naegleria gruberi]|eukprot:XP_002673885.1 hypothetical protein NAEGRDRAFT_80768 [Naegleria gruberi strain NEG-M]
MITASSSSGERNEKLSSIALDINNDRNNNKPLLSFTIYNNCSSSSLEASLPNTASLLNCEFSISPINATDENNQVTMIGVEITQAKFVNVRRTVFDAILSDFPSGWIEPKDVDHVFFTEHESVIKLMEGALCYDDDGFKFFSTLQSAPVDVDLKDLNIVKNCNKWNSYARLGSGDIPEAFHKFRIYHSKITVLQESQAYELIDQSDEIKYYLSCVQENLPLVRVTPRILSMFTEGLEKLTISNSFSENSLAMSVYTASFSNILQSHPFSNEDQIISLMNSSLTCYEFPRVDHRFIRSITSKCRNGVFECQVHLPEISETNRLFNKLGTDGFLKVKIIGQVPSGIYLQGKTYLPLGGSSNMMRERNMYFYDSSLYESVETIISQMGEISIDNLHQLCETECNEPEQINNGEPGYLTPSMTHSLIALGVQPLVLQTIFEEWFNSTVSNLTNPNFLLDLLKGRCRETLPAVQNLSEIPDNPFIEDLLRHLVSSHLQKVQNNLIIPIDKSITTTSLIDENKCLKENEMMVILGNEYLEDGTIVLVCNEPCLSQSNVKLFTVRNDETLKVKYETNHSLVILPSILKSDSVFACWDSRMIPTLVSSQITNSYQKLKTLSNSISRYLAKFRLDQLEKIESKLNGYKKNLADQQKEQDDIYIVGSLSILLHDPNETDCDWFIEPVSDNPTFFDDLCHRLSTYFKPIKEEYHKSVPLFRIYLQERDLRFLELIDLTNGDTGFRKKHHMRLYLAQQPKLLLILRILFDIIKKICAFHVKTFQLTWEVVDFCILRNYIHRERPPTRKESVDQEKQFSDSSFMKSVLSKCLESENFEKESELIIDFMKFFKLKNNMEFPDNLDDSKSYSATSDERKLEYAHDLIQTCLINLHLYRDFTKAILPTQVIQKTFEEFKNVDAKPVFRAESRDFVDGSVLTLFKGDSGESPINFTFYKGHVHAQHAKLPIHRPSLEKYNPESNNLISPMYDQKLSSQLTKMEDKPENYVFIIRFGVYYLVNMQKSIFSEITKPENSSVFNECMRKKAKVVKGPSADSFATGVSENVVPFLRPTDSPARMTEYSVSFYKNVNNKSTEFKVRLDENMKLKTKVISGQLRVISHTFIGKNNDMRFYINHLQYLDVNNEISELVDKLDKKGWLIKQGANDTEIVLTRN